MKKNNFSTIVAGIATLGSLVFAQPVKAQATTFMCDYSYSGLLTTYAILADNSSKPVIRWVSNHFSNSGYTPAQRCQMVSERFARLHSQGRLQVLNTGWVNAQPVICAGYSCTSENLLFTLRPDQSPGYVLSELIANRSSASVVSYQSSGSSSDSLTIDFQTYLDGVPTEERGGSAGTAPASQTAPSPQPAAPAPAPSSSGSAW